MAETPDNPESRVPEKPASLVAMEKEFQQLGRDVKIRIPSGGPKAPRFVSASDLTFVYDTPPRGTKPMWLLGHRPKGYNAYPISKVLVPVASYGDAMGSLYVLPVPGNAEALANGADIFDQLSEASKKAGRIEISNRFRDNWARPLRGAGILIGELYPQGRAQSLSSSTLAIAKNLGTVELITRKIETKKGEKGKAKKRTVTLYRPTKKNGKSIPVAPGYARAILVAHSLDAGTAKRAMAATSLEATVEVLKEAQSTQKARSKEMGAKSLPLRRVSAKKLAELTSSPDLPPEPREGVQPLNRERAFEERRFAKQRGDDRPSFRGKKSASMKQRDLLLSKLVELGKLLKPSPEDTPAESQLKSRVREGLKRDIPREIRGGTIQVKRGGGVESQFLKPLEAAGFLSKQDASRFIEVAMRAIQTLNPQKRTSLRQGPYSKITRMLPQLPASATPDVVADVLRRRLPSTVTMGQAGEVNLGRAAAQRTADILEETQRASTISREERDLAEIETRLKKLSGDSPEGTLGGGLSKVTKRSLEALQKFQATPQDQKAVINLAREFGKFGTEADSATSLTNFVNSFFDDIERIKVNATDGDPALLKQVNDPDPKKARRAQRALEQSRKSATRELKRAESTLGIPLTASRQAVKARLTQLHLQDEANRAVQALVGEAEDIQRRMPTKPVERLKGGGVMAPKGVEPVLTPSELAQSARTGLARITGRPAAVPPRGTAPRIVELDGAPRTSIIGGRTTPEGTLARMGPEVGGLTPARLPAPAPGSERVPFSPEQLRMLAAPRRFSVAELESLPAVQPIAARPTSVAPELRREAESLFVRSDLREGPAIPAVKPKKARMRVRRGR